MCARDLLRLGRDARECTGGVRDCPTCPLGSLRRRLTRGGGGAARGRGGAAPDEPGHGQSSVPPRNEFRVNVHGSHLIRGGIAVWARVHEAFILIPFLWRTPPSATVRTSRSDAERRPGAASTATVVTGGGSSPGSGGFGGPWACRGSPSSPPPVGPVRYGTGMLAPLPTGRDDPAVIVTPVLAASRRRRVSAAGR